MSVPIRSPFDRPRWTEQDASAALAALERSGKTAASSPRSTGSIRRGSGLGVAASPEATVPLAASWSCGIHRRLRRRKRRGRFEVRLPSGIVIRVPAAFESAALARLLDVLSQASGCCLPPSVRLFVATQPVDGHHDLLFEPTDGRVELKRLGLQRFAAWVRPVVDRPTPCLHGLQPRQRRSIRPLELLEARHLPIPAAVRLAGNPDARQTSDGGLPLLRPKHGPKLRGPATVSCRLRTARLTGRFASAPARIGTGATTSPKQQSSTASIQKCRRAAPCRPVRYSRTDSSARASLRVPARQSPTAHATTCSISSARPASHAHASSVRRRGDTTPRCDSAWQNALRVVHRTLWAPRVARTEDAHGSAPRTVSATSRGPSDPDTCTSDVGQKSHVATPAAAKTPAPTYPPIDAHSASCWTDTS